MLQPKWEFGSSALQVPGQLTNFGCSADGRAARDIGVEGFPPDCSSMP